MSKRVWLGLVVVAVAGFWFVPVAWVKWMVGAVSLSTLAPLWEKYSKWREGRRPVQLLTHNVCFNFMGTDRGGGTSNVAREHAQWIAYWFELHAFNPRPDNVGLCDLRLRFEKAGALVKEQVPTVHTGEVRCSATYCPDVVTLTLPSKAWDQVVFQGGAGLAVADCDAIFLTARSVNGEQFKVRLADGVR